MDRIRNLFWSSLPLSVFIQIFNHIYRYTRFPKWSLRLRRITSNIFSIEDVSGNRIVLGRRNRIIKYSTGINARIVEIEDKYFLRDVEISPGDLIIDIGANIGEVSMALLNRGVKIRIIAVEADPLEFECLKLNLGKNHTDINAFLFSGNISINISMPSIYENASGDTRLKPEFDEVPQVFVETHTLDSLTQDYKNERVQLMKIEVEGSEPEVLRGARDTLMRTKYVAVDTSLERGAKQLSTFESVNRILTESGFTLIRQDRNESALYG